MNDTDLFKQLAELPTYDVSFHEAEKIRRRAQALLAQERHLATHPWLAQAAHLWNGLLEPALAAGVVSVYLAWLLQTLKPLLQ